MLNFFCALIAVFAVTGFSTNAFAETNSPNNEQVTTSAESKAKPKRRISVFGDAPMFNPSQETMDRLNDPQEPFNGYQMRRSIGFEGGLPLGGSGSLSTSVLASPAMSYSVWNSPTSGWEFFFGTSKTADTQNTQETYTPTYSGTTLTATSVATTYGGVANPRAYIFGLAYKHRLYQFKHFGLSLDFLATFMPKRSAEYYGSGTKTVTVADVTNPGNYTVNESNISSKQTNVDSIFGFGPRFNIEYNFPYVPNLLIGMATGVFVNVGGDTTTVSTTINKSITYTGGVAGTPTYNAGHGTTQTTVTDPGASGSTYAIGGTGLNLTGAGGLIPISMVGTFRIRYAF